MTSDIRLLQLVFTFHIVDQIVHADDAVDALEIDWVRARFPREKLEEHGLISAESTLTQRYRDLLAEALMRLPRELNTAEKSSLIQTFYSTALADGDFEVREGKLIVVAAELLGLPINEIHEHLPDLGELEPDD